MAHSAVRGFSPTVLKWLIPVLLGRSTTTSTGHILDLPAKRGYRAKEMLSSHTFAASASRGRAVTKIAHAKFAPRKFAVSEFGSRPDIAPNAAFSARSSFDAATPANERRARP